MGDWSTQGLGLLDFGLNAAYDQATMGQQMNNQIELMGITQQNEMELMDKAQQNQYALNVQGQQLQMDMWNQTNYSAQMEHMRKAGLNPALMYGKGAGQGGTTGSQTGGAAAKGSAAQGHAPRSSGAIMDLAQANLMEEQAKDLESQRNKRDGVDTDYTASQTANQNMDTELKRLKKEWNEKGYIDGQPIATMMNILGKDPINNEDDRSWLLNRLYGYFGLKAATDIVQTIISAKTMRNVLQKGPNPKKGGTGGMKNRNGSPINTKEIKIVNPNKAKRYGNKNSGHNMPKPTWEEAFGGVSENKMGISIPSFTKTDKWWK